MEREQAIAEIRASWKKLYQADKKNKGIICPLCKSGMGDKGTGITGDSNHNKPNSLKCWKCGFTGDVIDLMMQETGADFNTVINNAAANLGIVIDGYNQSAEQVKHRLNNHINTQEAPTTRPQQDQKELADYTAYYKECAGRLTDTAAISYLTARGISLEIAKEYHLGYDPEWKSPTVIKSQMEKGSNWQPDPTQRIIMPVSKNHYIARAVNQVKEFAKMNETGGGAVGIFNKVALDGKEKNIFVVEGFFDALSIIEVGAAAIALNSTSNVSLLLKYLEEKPTEANLIICLDNDTAGQNATKTLREGLQRLNINHITANICGNYSDPNEALTGDKKAFIDAIIQAMQQAEKQANKTYMQDFFEKIQTEAYKPYKTGVNFFDDLLGGGVVKQSLLLLLAAPGTGKTTLCQQITEAMAANKKRAIYFNLEMSREQMLAKTLSCKLAQKGKFYSATDILQGYKWNEQQKEDISQVLEEYNDNIYPYLKYNPQGISADKDDILNYLTSIGEAAKAKNEDAPIVVIDYLHLITNKDGLDNQELIKQIIIGLKKYALDYNSIVIAISATGREANKGGRMTINSGRDSSNLEYTGDYMLGLNYKAVYNGSINADNAEEMAKLQQEKPRQMILQVLKARLGEQGKTAEINYNAKYNFFYANDELAPCNDAPFNRPRKRKPL